MDNFLEIIFGDNASGVFVFTCVLLQLINTYFNGDFRFYTANFFLKETDSFFMMNLAKYYIKLGVIIFMSISIPCALYIILFFVYRIILN